MKKPYKIGYTTGVFDMFHVGHLNILRRAKEQCEYLIVGVSTDALAREYKKKYPIICQENRFEIVQAIRYVDRVVWQEDMNKYAAWEQLRFDAMFHGDDWENSALYEEYKKTLGKIGVKLVFLPHTKGVSSTIIRRQIGKKAYEE
ncbi:adenylyltransferase/cytidyltransferase family protein [Allofournierella sp.]|uniref:adenylyltransferase/cytidyltransferase family protein n=1 Tax=Allofournierella sp. TaxID=1940256 RepID=UPI003AB2331B